ncbi:Nucleotide-binding alpha-beta plait [Penicillium malachiteum]|uniref:Nucleotide-binding alpha-beta plait n=1 Tax=Penicillium malachiteum TaxID=1324776 RepID=A0AAD6MRY2_9EURO|nr:Nucleotide-binding alpha-beta plait [Penicillium malachiteum]
MTPSPPDEALHFRGKTLTPESPRPLHIPEPSNIPVLENQMDPVFNDTSTYERSVYTQPPQTHDGYQWSGLESQDRGGQVQDSGRLRGSMPGDLVMMNEMPVSTDLYHSHPPLEQSGEVSMNSHSQLINTHAPPVHPVHQGFATASEVDNAGNRDNGSQLPQRLDEGKEGAGSGTTGVNFQTLLDNLSHPPAMTFEATPLAESSSLHQAPSDDSYQSQGLPTRPQDPSTTQPNYISHDDATYHQHPAGPVTTSAYPTQPSNNAQHHPQAMAPGGAPGTVPGAPSLSPPPIASFQQTPSTGGDSQTSQEGPKASRKPRIDKQTGRPIKPADDDAPWGPEVQKKYDEFLHDERIYVTEGLWDRFPVGSRLFVGNLPTERVTKRDMFHIFHQYGKLAQISIKQAYGFIQFLEADACHASLQAEQGALTLKSQSRSVLPAPRPRKHLAHPRLDAQDHQSSAALALPELIHVPQVTDMIDLMSRADSRSAIFGMKCPIADEMITALHSDLIAVNAGVLGHHDHLVLLTQETVGIVAPVLGLEVSMREKPTFLSLAGPPRDVPEVQVLVLEEVDRNFILHVENAFRNRGLRVDVLVLGPRIPLGAAVHRQYVEGVLAVVRLSRPNQFSRKIPLQIFDRSAGPGNVRFSDYPEVDPNIAAELIFHQAHAMQRGPAPTSFVPNPAFGVAPVPTVPVPMPQPTLPTLTNPPNIANLIGSLDGPSLQSLLSALQQQRPAPQSQPVSTTQSPFASPNPPPPADLASLLTNASRPVPLPQPHQQHIPPPPFHLQPPNAPVVSDPHLLSILAKGLGNQQPQGQPAIGSNVQNLMNQLAKWKQ